MPAVTPAEPHNPELRGRPHAIQPARLRAPPQPAPFSSYLRVLRGLFFSVSSVPSVLLARRFFSAREDFLCRHTCLVAALPRCGLPSPCPPCRVRCGAGFPAGLGPLYPVPLLQPIAPAALAARRFACHTGTSCGASRQACHAGGHAGRATQSRAARASPRHPAHTTARSTSSRPLSSYLRVLRGLFFSVSSVSSVLLARRFFSAREDFLCRHTCLVAALPRCTTSP